MKTTNIESFFLNTLLAISIAGVSLVLLSNLILFPDDKLSIGISMAILMACCVSYSLRKRHPTLAVLSVTTVALVAMCYQRLTVPNTTTTLSIVLIVGFIFSVMLKGTIMWIMHGIAFTIINTIFVFHLPDAITAAITYSTLYVVLTYATGMLKSSYDRIHEFLREMNNELTEKANKIEVQNQELLQTKDSLSALNLNLEKIVNERTEKIQKQNEILIRYSYTNAHHLRGPVARLLGLANIYELKRTEEPDFFISKMVKQALEIDQVVKQINSDLELHDLENKGRQQ